jgi:hypothetical protein
MAGARRPAGKDAVYAGCELEPMQWSATTRVDHRPKEFSLCFILFLFPPVLQLNLLALCKRLLSERELFV